MITSDDAESDHVPKILKVECLFFRCFFVGKSCRIILHRRWFWQRVTVSLWIGGHLVFLCSSVLGKSDGSRRFIIWAFQAEHLQMSGWYSANRCADLPSHWPNSLTIIWNERSNQEKKLKHKKPLDTMIEFFGVLSSFKQFSNPDQALIRFFWQVRTHVGQATLRILQPDADLCANTQRIEEGRPMAVHGVMSLAMPECIMIWLLTCKSWKTRNPFLHGYFLAMDLRLKSYSYPKKQAKNRRNHD